jgi:hypothetical protein
MAEADLFFGRYKSLSLVGDWESSKIRRDCGGPIAFSFLEDINRTL